MDEYIGIVKLFAGGFAPKGWAFCQGQILSIAQNTALFSILGTTYGGNGTNTFGLPDLRSRVPVGAGQGPGTGYVSQGEMGGTANTTLLSINMPPHKHHTTIVASTTNAEYSQPQGTSVFAAPGKPAGRDFENFNGFTDVTPDIKLTASLTEEIVGGGAPFSNMQPYTGMNYIICLQGVFPPRD